jgi:AraC family transcriptional regulator, chitin signaling transcriptional activator
VKFLPLFLLVLFVVMSPVLAALPDKGMPRLRNISPAEQLNMGKVWGIDSAPNGIVYMAADKGLLEFDGHSWQAFKGSAGFTRSVRVISDSLIFTGSDLDFGVWRGNAHFGFEYTSLYPFREELASLAEEFWQVHTSGGNILFVSEHNIYVYQNQNLTKISAPSRFTGSFSVGEKLYFTDERLGLLQLRDLTLHPLVALPSGNAFDVRGMYMNGEILTLVTRSTGLFELRDGVLRRITTSLSRMLENANVFDISLIGEEHVAIGTVMSGLYIADFGGNLLHHVNRSKGLANNTVLSVHYSRHGTLWMGLDFGVASLDLYSDVRYVYDYRGDFGTGYSAVIDGERFILGTNKGLFSVPWDAVRNSSEYIAFNQISGSDGQVWSLLKIGSQLLAGHDLGLFEVRGNQLEQVADLRGIWTMLPHGGMLLAGTYNGIAILAAQGDRWVLREMMPEILGSASQLFVDQDSMLWVHIPNFGIIRAELDANLHPINRTIFPTAQFLGENLHVSQDSIGVLVLTDAYSYRYNANTGSFTDSEVPNLKSPVEGRLPGIFPPTDLNETFRFYPVYNGFALKNIDFSGYAEVDILPLVLRRVESYNNHERIVTDLNARIPFSRNNLKLTVLIPAEPDAWYQYQLEKGASWSAWSSDPILELVALPFGKHVISVRAMVRGELSEPLQISLSIGAPWYLSVVAILLYILIAVGIVSGISMWQRRSLERQRRVLQDREQLALLEQSEVHRRERMQLEQDRLQVEITLMEQQLRSKTIELANRAKDSENKNRVLLTLREKMEKLEQRGDNSSTQWKEIFKLMDSCIEPEDNTFEIQLNELHQEFFRKLREAFSDLSGNDLRLCAYIKLGFNSKEIADLMHIQPSSVYISRSRLRKKLNLGADDDLYSYLNSIS